MSHCATEANRLWAWDITWLPAGVKGLYFYWHMVLDIYSRKIVGHEVRVTESAELATLEKLGVMPSFSRPRVSNDNAYAESLSRTCKYRPNFPGKPFGSVDEAREWTLKFVQRYNHQHKHSGLKFVTPAQRHDGRDTAILRHREHAYEAAKQRRPERWSGTTRDWKLKEEVWPNAERSQLEALKQVA